MHTSERKQAYESDKGEMGYLPVVQKRDRETTARTLAGVSKPMKTSQVESALGEMEYKTNQGSMGQNMDVAIPCQLRFVEEPEQNTERFHEALEERGYTSIDTEADRIQVETSGPYYDGRICSKKTYDRMKVVVFRGNAVRLYPNDGWEPTLEELASITKAIEIGFGAELQHDPIEE